MTRRSNNSKSRLSKHGKKRKSRPRKLWLKRIAFAGHFAAWVRIYMSPCL